MDQSTRRLLIQSAVTTLGTVPTIRAMHARLVSEGIQVSVKTVSTDYERLGLHSPAKTGRKRTGQNTMKVEMRFHNSVYDQCCRIARRRGVSVPAVIRALVAKAMRAGAA